MVELDFLNCMDYLTANDLEFEAIEHLLAIAKAKAKRAENKKVELQASMRAARKIIKARYNDEAIDNLLEGT